MDAPSPVARLGEGLAALERAYSPGHHGPWVARKRASLVDDAVVALFEAATSSLDRAPRMALVALGGYGRGALCPRSDVDLLLVHEAVSDPFAFDAVMERILYPLWDVGLSVGHAVRTPEEGASLAADRLDAATAMLDARSLAGDARVFEQAVEVVRAPLRAHPETFAARLAENVLARRERFGAATDLLEPELKEGGGGLRDVHALRWLEAVRGRPLEDDGLLRPGDRPRLEEAEAFLTRVRSALHLETGRRTDRLIMEQQPAVAKAMGFEDEPRLLAVDALMRAVFERTRAVDAAMGDAVLRSTSAAGIVPRERSEPSALADVLAMVAAAAEDDRPLAPAELDAAEMVVLEDDDLWGDAVRTSFLRILRAHPGGPGGLQVLVRLGWLARLIPEWDDVRCRPQRDPYHRYTVDVHLLRTLGGMVRALTTPDDTDPIEQEAVSQVIDRDGVLLGALLHDIGKNGEGSHVAVGDRVAAGILERMGLPTATADLARFMVAEHLLLPDTATRRDLTDDDLVLDVAARVGTPERLAALYLLAKADARATGPAAWTPWRQTLVRELVVKVERVLERGEMGPELAERLTDRIGRVRDLLPGEPEADVERFVMRMPRSYFLSLAPGRVAEQFATIAPELGSSDVRTLTTTGSRPGTHELLVVAADRAGLLSSIAGALSLAGLSILSAQVFTTDDGVAVDVFEVEGAFEVDVGEERWRRFRGTLRKAIEGRISLERRMDEHRRHYPPQRLDTPVTVSIDNAASDFFTVVEVGAADRVGLLYDITRSLAELRLDVHLAKVATYTGRVIDAFYVRDDLGRKVIDPDRAAAIERSIRERIV